MARPSPSTPFLFLILLCLHPCGAPSAPSSYEATEFIPRPSVCVSAFGLFSSSSAGTRLGATGVQRAAKAAKLAVEKREEEVKKRVTEEELERLD